MQPIPSGGERQCVCSLSDPAVELQHNCGYHKYPAEPTPAAQPKCNGKCTWTYADKNCPIHGVSAEATKPAVCPSCQATDNNAYTDQNGVQMRACGRCMIQWRAVPPVAPPEAEGAREWLERTWLKDSYVSSTLSFGQIAEYLDAYAAFKLAQKEAEISRLTAERDYHEQQSTILDTAFHEVCCDFHSGDNGFQEMKQSYIDGAKAEIKMLDILVPIAVAEIEESLLAKERKRADKLLAANTELRTALTKLSDAALKLCEWVPDSSKGSSGYIRKERVKELAALAKGE